MSFQLLAQIVLALSFLGMLAMILRKIPALARLPENAGRSEGYILKLKKKAQAANPFKGTKPEVFLQKMLSRVRILSLKTDNKAMDWIQTLGKRIDKKNNNFFHQIFPEEKNPFSRPDQAGQKSIKQDDYWKDIKKSVSTSAAAKRKSSAKRSKKK